MRESMGGTLDSIRARDVNLDRLNEITTWVALAAVGALGVFGFIAAVTVPGQPSSDQNAGTATTSTSSSTPSSTSSSFFHHHHDGSGTISSSTGPPMAVTGGSH